MSTTLRTLGIQVSSHHALFAGLRALLCVCLLSCSAAQFACGDDLVPPPWRGGLLSTVAEWDFQTPGAGPPDGTSVVPVIGNSGGTPLAIPGLGINWDPFDGTGAWIGQGPSGGTIGFEIPNWIDTEPIKFIQIQMTFQPNPVIPFPGVTQMTASDPLGVAIAQTGVVEFPIPGVNGMWQRIEQWEIRPNPDNEFFVITIPPDTVLSQVVVDTISVPEPSSAILAALGLIGLAAWGRRRRKSR
jgi:hypothetical protein